MPVEVRDNASTDEWRPSDDMTRAEINRANSFYGWTKFRIKEGRP